MDQGCKLSRLKVNATLELFFISNGQESLYLLKKGRIRAHQYRIRSVVSVTF